MGWEIGEDGGATYLELLLLLLVIPLSLLNRAGVLKDVYASSVLLLARRGIDDWRHGDCAWLGIVAGDMRRKQADLVHPRAPHCACA